MRGDAIDHGNLACRESTQPGLSFGRALFSIVNQKIRQPRMQKMAIRLTRRSAARSFNFSALKADLSILKNSSIFHLMEYQVILSIA
jgi:hypothetical protein